MNWKIFYQILKYNYFAIKLVLESGTPVFETADGFSVV
jgi:hypothetical protein